MLIRNTDRAAAYRALINTALKDKRKYCNNCGSDVPGILCCNDPQIGDNASHARAVVVQNKLLRESRKNDFASTDNKTIRWGVSLPSWMYQILDNYEKKQGDGRRLFKTNDDINWFAKNFPVFAIAKRV